MDIRTILIKEVAALVPADRLQEPYKILHGHGLFDTIAEEVLEKIPPALELTIADGALALSRRPEPEREGLDKFIAQGKIDLIGEKIPAFKDFLAQSVYESKAGSLFK